MGPISVKVLKAIQCAFRYSAPSARSHELKLWINGWQFWQTFLSLFKHNLLLNIQKEYVFSVPHHLHDTLYQTSNWILSQRAVILFGRLPLHHCLIKIICCILLDILPDYVTCFATAMVSGLFLALLLRKIIHREWQDLSKTFIWHELNFLIYCL